jgi:hypothetical protein
MTNDLTVNQPRELSQPTVIEVIQALAVDERVNVEKLAALMGLQERAEAREAERQFNIDFAAAMARMPTIAKDKAKEMKEKGSIPYASYENLDKTIRPIEREFGFCRTFSTAPLEKAGSLMTLTLVHKGGHSRTSTRYQSPDPGPGRNDAQAQGSADSYNKRYLTIGIWNIVTVGADDDGNRACAITRNQADDINSLISEIGMTAAGRQAFFQLADVSSVEEIPQRRYKDIMQALQSKRATKK